MFYHQPFAAEILLCTADHNYKVFELLFTYGTMRL